MLFDGAVAATVADTATEHPAAAEAAANTTADSNAGQDSAHATADITPTGPAEPGQTVVFVDARVKDSDSLIAGVAAGTDVVRLDASREGLQQIAEYLDAHSGVSSVQIIAHGNAGDLWLGSTHLSSDNLNQYSGVLAQIGQDMNAGGDILIYACNTAEGEEGLDFVNALAISTGRDIAASSNRTGMGGDWSLEVATGSLESTSALSQQVRDGYQWGLQTLVVSNYADTGNSASLRNTLASAQAGDIITFSTPGATVLLDSQLTISKNITLDGDLDNNGTADITLDAQYKSRVLEVTSGSTVTLDGLVVTRGLIAGNGADFQTLPASSLGAGIANSGNLTLNNVTVTANAASGGGGANQPTSPYRIYGNGGGGGGGVKGDTGPGIGGGSGGSDSYGDPGSLGGSGTGGKGGTTRFYSAWSASGGSTTGGAGGQSNGRLYASGGTGGSASSASIRIGGGGGAVGGYLSGGGKGGDANGGIFNSSGAVLTIIGRSSITDNAGAGGGGSAGGSTYIYDMYEPDDPRYAAGAGGLGVGAIWNAGTLNINTTSYASMTGNDGAGGNGGKGGVIGERYVALDGATPAGVDTLHNLGTLNLDYARATIALADSSLQAGQTTQVTLTFSEAVTGFDSSDLVLANGTLGPVSSTDGGITWTATFTPDVDIDDTSNVITLDLAKVLFGGTAGTGNASSGNYTVDTLRPTVAITVADADLKAGETTRVTFAFNEAVSDLTLADLTVQNGTLSAVSSSDGGLTWTATLTPAANVQTAANLITLNNTGVLDAAGNTGAGSSTASYAIDTLAPTATIAVTDTALKSGQATTVTITFSEAVTDFDVTDLLAPDGSVSGLGSADGGTTWTASYTPTDDVIAVASTLVLNTAHIKDLAGNTGSVSVTSNSFSIDSLRPIASIVMADSVLSVGESSTVTITFSEAVSGFSNDDLTVENGTLSAVSSANGGLTWTATFTPTVDLLDASNVISLTNAGISDAAGNTGSGSTVSNTYVIDTLRPTASIAMSDLALKAGDSATVTITFSEAVSGFSNDDLTVENGTLSAVSSSDGGLTWTATFTPAVDLLDASNVISLDNAGVLDAVGNAGSGSTASTTYVIDTRRPTATIAMSDLALTAGDTATVTIIFSEAVSGLSNDDLTVENGTLSAVSSGDGGLTWTATFTPAVDLLDASNVISLNTAGVLDAAGNAGSGTTASTPYFIDTVRPTASITMSDRALKVGDTATVTITFSEAVSGFSNADLSVANGTLSTMTSGDGGSTWTADFIPDTNIEATGNVITLANSGVVNATGNAGAGTTDSASYSVDTLAPTATIVMRDSALIAGETSRVTLTFSEAVSDFSNDDLSVESGILSAVSSSDGGLTWTATFTPTADLLDASNVISLNNAGVLDAAGNAGSGTTDSDRYAIDTVRPTASITMSDRALKIGDTATVTITFSEAVSGFSNADLSVANGTLGTATSGDGGITWTADFTPNTNIEATGNVITLANSGVLNATGNAGTGTTGSSSYSIDTRAPTATIVMADNALVVGETSRVTITFSEAVSGFTNADLSVVNGTLSAVASTDGGLTWTATFTPKAATSDSSNLISLNRAGVTDAVGNTGSGTTVSNNYAIDTVRPTATIVVADSALKAGETSLVTITFSEAVSGFTNADLSVANGTLSTVTSTNGGLTWTATFTPASTISDSTNLISLTNTGVSDAAGNTGSGTTVSNNYTLDTVRPTATIVLADTALKVGETSLVTITFSEAVSGFTNADLSVANGTLSTVTSANGGLTWTATFTPKAATSDSTNLISLNNAGVSDAAGNAGSGTTVSNNYAIDILRPMASIEMSDLALRAGDTTTVTIIFSEAVNGFGNDDLSVENGTLSAVTSLDGGLTWTATFTPAADVTDASNLIVLNNAGVLDAAGNAGRGGTTSDSYAIDTLRPTATIVLADTALKAGETSLVTITFSEAVSGFTNADLSVANGTLSTVTSANGELTWTATFTPKVAISDSTNLITLNQTGVSDTAGNIGSGTAVSTNYAIDTVRPTATIVVADTSLKAGETSLVTITFSEAVSGFTNADLSVANGTLSTVTSANGGLTWTATLTPTSAVTDSTNLISLNKAGVSDAAGNAGSGSTVSNNYAILTVRPTATIIMADTALKAGETSLVTISFSEAVSGFTNADLSVANGTLSAVTSTNGGLTWTATFTPKAAISDSTNLISLNRAGVSNAAGNAGSGTTVSSNYAIDTLRPTATIAMSDLALKAGETSLVTITFNEAVSGFTNADLSVANGTLSAVTSTNGGLTWTATFTPNAAISDSTNVISLNKAGVIDAAGNTGSGMTPSSNYAIDTIRPTASIVVADSALKVGETSRVTITFNEAVSGFTNADLSVANGTLSTVTSTNGGLTWTATFTPKAAISDSTNLISLNKAGVSDAAGNIGSGTTVSNNYAIDTVQPAATRAVSGSVQSFSSGALTLNQQLDSMKAVENKKLLDLALALGSLA
ncbi:Ig-like domain-containing protein [Pseudomonas ovata]|uniref:Ig-like domain-containing protein n=1 Tax=Pseudomonas ovata TaxID=1839709 RepID=UPI001F4E57B3|nr:Ig-like domain-containing protein [Pseudomonas ovata]